MNLELLTRNAGRSIKENAPAILSALGVGGVLTTAYLASQAGAKAALAIYEAEEIGIEPLAPKEKVAMTWKLYIPTLLVGGSTIACIVAAHSINSRRQAALISAVTLGEAAFREYRDKMIEVVGEAKDTKAIDEISKADVEKNPPTAKDLLIVAEGDQLCRDRFSGRYFKTTIDKLNKAEIEINRQINRMDYALVNDFYELIGLERVDMGDEFGFNSDNMLELQYSSTLYNEDPILVVSFRRLPTFKPYKVF